MLPYPTPHTWYLEQRNWHRTKRLQVLACLVLYPTHLLAERTPAALKALKRSTGKHNKRPLDFIYKRAMKTVHTKREGRKSLVLKSLSWLVKARRTLTFDELEVAIYVKH